MSYTYEALSPGGHQEMLKEVFSKVREQVGSYKTASGSLVSFSDGADLPMPSFVCNIDAVQDLHGYDYPWAGGAGKNKLQNTKTTREINGVTFTVNSDGSVTANGTATAEAQFTIPIDTSTIYGDLYFVGCSGGSNSTYNVFMWDNTTDSRVKKWNGTTNAAFSVDGTLQEIKIVQGNTVNMVLRVMSGQTVNNVIFQPMICLSTETDATFAPYSNICPISGHTGVDAWVRGINLLNNDDAEIGKAWNGGSNSARARLIISIPTSISKYTLSLNGTMTVSNLYIKDSNVIPSTDAGTDITNSIQNAPVALNTKGKKYLILAFSKTSITKADIEAMQLQLEVGEDASIYTPYSGQTIQVSWQTEAGEVYGGYIDLVSGELTVTDGYIASYNGETLPSTWISDRDTYAEGTSPTTGAEVVYKLATPITYQLSPTQIKSLLGNNNAWCDTGDVDIEYFGKGETE